MKGYVLDAGILQGIAKEANTPHRELTRWLIEHRARGTRLVTLKEVLAECINVPTALLMELSIEVEPARAPHDPQKLLDAFSDGSRTVNWSIDPLRRADRAVMAHAIVKGYDVVTTDGSMRTRSFRELITRLQRTADEKLPAWHIPEIIVRQRGLMH